LLTRSTNAQHGRYSLSNVKGISDDCKKHVLIDIELTTEEEIRIRGSKLLDLDSLKN